jgi:hypothetical protein
MLSAAKKFDLGKVNMSDWHSWPPAPSRPSSQPHPHGRRRFAAFSDVARSA